METTQNTETNAYGFPVETCERCSGTGKFSFNERDGDRCFGCNGAGVKVHKRARKAWLAFLEAKKADAFRQASDIKVGDKLITNAKRVGEVIEIRRNENNGHFTFVLHNNFNIGSSGTIPVQVHNPDFDPAPFLATIKGVK